MQTNTDRKRLATAHTSKTPGANTFSSKTVVSTIFLMSVLGGMVGATRAAHSDSLYPKEGGSSVATSSSASMVNLYSDTRARRVGDVLTIIVSETTTAQSAANTKVSQDDNVSAFSGTGLVQRFFRDLSLTAVNTRSGTGDGSTTRSGSLATTLSVTVKEVLPNNTLRIEGQRIMGINRETQRVTFTGIVRPEDILPNNTISSSLIAAMEVHYDGKGIVGDTQRQGVLSRIFHFLF